MLKRLGLELNQNPDPDPDMPTLLQESTEQVSWEDIHARTSTVTPKPVHHRTPGLHLSGVLRYIAINTGMLKGVDPTTGKWIGDEGADLLEEDMPLRMALGMAFEEWVAPLYPEMYWQPGELTRDGIIGSPDGITLSDPDGLPIIEEFKCTWKSARQGILDRKLWIWQGGCYAWMYGTNYVRFNVLWVNGDYTRGGPGGPIYKRYLMYYPDVEMRNTWAMVLKNMHAPGVKVEG